MGTVIRVLIADDHPVVRQGVRQIVSTTADIIVVDDVTDGREVVEHALRVEPDLVLLDVSMPGKDGLDVLKDLKKERPQLPVLILTMHSEDQFAMRALMAGASGYVTKDTATSELVGAIRRVMSGQRYLSPWLTERLARRSGPASAKPPHERLSDREYQVLRMIAMGKTTRQISEELSLSVKTIGTYRSRIFLKMQMKTPAELAAYVVRNRLSN